MQPSTKSEYFQRQSLFSSQCGLCAVNNFLGTQAFTKQNMEDMCQQLSSQSMDTLKSFFGGDYDISVLTLALGVYQFAIQWVSPDKDVSEVVRSQQFEGFLLNTSQSKTILHTLFDKSGKHWTCMKPQNGKFVHYDSLKQRPELLTKQQVQQKIKSILNNKGTAFQIIQYKDLEDSMSKSVMQAKSIHMRNKSQLYPQ